jgi:cytidylate kinase
MIIAIDGPAGAGKSTVARELARELGLVYLDTGAMYRALTLAVVEHGLDPRDEESCAHLATRVRLDFTPDGKILIDGRPGEPRIRQDDRVARWVSVVSAHPRVRRAIVERQRALAADRRSLRGLVAEGRDTATTVFPGADLKVFLTAEPATRAARRAAELGRPPGEVEVELRARDELDSTRTTSPLVPAADSVHVATDGKSVAQVVAEILALAKTLRARRAGAQG